MKSGKIFCQIPHGLHNILDRLMHALGAGVCFLLDLALNLGLDFFQVLSMFFKLQAMLFLHVFDGIGINLLDEFIGFSQ